jgi:putative ABC transport system permease protein
MSARSAACVVGTEVGEELFGRRDIVGEEVRIDGRRFTVVGVLEDLGDSVSGTQNNQVLIPFTTAQRLFRDTAITTLYASALSENEADVERAMDTLDRLLYKKLGDEDDYSVSSMTRLLETMNTVTTTMTMMLAGIAGHLAAGGRHRHHEHHAGVGLGAHPGDRHPQGHRRPARRHHDAVFDRGGGDLAGGGLMGLGWDTG